ncbi:hypothetical protein BST61_g2695 [Cercospora zeina]
MHWAFVEIDPNTWEVVINDPGSQWEIFKSMTYVKRVVSFGGWAYSTEPDTYNIIRQAILVNYEAFTDNIVRFIEDNNLQVDIDWEYLGSIADKSDGELYLRFLRVLREKLDDSKTVAIAAPASYWFLEDAIAKVVDYIVYMTYNMHGQWDYRNPNAFDNCDSGKCIRSHVNLTETINALGIITKAGEPTNKIFVGEASYGRSFHMADPNSMAEIDELLVVHGYEAQLLHDSRSNSDIVLYNGDYISYMTEETKATRRTDWKKLNFAGNVDSALDLQRFSPLDGTPPSNIPAGGEYGCIDDMDKTPNTECVVYKDLRKRDETMNHCLNFCAHELDKAKEEGRTTNYGCISLGLPDQPPNIQWKQDLYTPDAAAGRCLCDNYEINAITDAVIEALPSVAQIGCAILMQSLKFVVTLGTAAFPQGRALHSGLDALLTATQMINQVYPEDQRPGEAFDWWLSPCGGEYLQ